MAIRTPGEREEAVLLKEWTASGIAPMDTSPSGAVIVLRTDATADLAARLFVGRPDLEVVHGVTDLYSARAGELLHDQVRGAIGDRKLLGVIDLTAHDRAHEQATTVEDGKLSFLRTCIERERRDGMTLLQVTYQLQAWQTPAPTLQGARTVGLYRMLGAEYKQVRSITMDSDCSVADGSALATQIETEFLGAARWLSSECCYRSGRRFEPRLVASPVADGAPRTYASTDVLLITGGTRGIGAAVAERAVAQGCRHLVLMGREERESLGPDKGARLRQLAERGAQVLYYNTALTDERALRAMVDHIHREAGPITGVVHCAGLVGKNPAFISKSAEEIRAVCEPKIAGLVALHESLKDEPLDSFVLFSSVSSAAPVLAAGMGDYGMANAYMDFYAAAQAAQGRRYFRSIQWPAWGEVGVAAGHGVTPAYQKTGLVPITTAEGLSFLDRLVRLPAAVACPFVGRVPAAGFDIMLQTNERAVSPAVGVEPPRPRPRQEEARSRGEGKIFESVLAVDNPIIKDHVVHGQRILPGLAYVDMLYQLAREALGIDHASFALRRIAIFHPLALVDDRPVHLRIAFGDLADGWSVEVAGRDAEGEERKVYLTAELRARSAPFTRVLPVDAIREGAGRRLDLESVYADCRARGLVHRGMIKARGDVHLTGSAMLAELRVDDEYHEGAKAFLLHPTLIDGAAVATYAIDGLVERGELFIPLFYEEFHAVEPLQASCLACVDLSSVRKRNDVTSLDIGFFDPAGRQVGALTGFTSKKVRDERSLAQAPRKRPTGVSAARAPISAAGGDLEAGLRAIFAGQLDVHPDEIELDTVFFEMGLQSVELLRVVKAIETQLDLSLSPTLLFETNNVRELIAYLAPEVVKAGTKASTPARAASPTSTTTVASYAFFGNEPYLQDHRVFGRSALMGVTHPSLALETYLQDHPFPVELGTIEFVGGPITLEPTESARIGVHLHQEDGITRFSTSYHLDDPGDSKVCCRGTVSGSASPPADRLELATLLRQATALAPETVAGWYELVPGFQIGPMLRTVEEAYVVDDSTLLMRVNLQGRLAKGDLARLAFDPLLFNTAYMVFHHIDPSRLQNIFVPMLVERLTVYRPMTETGYVVNVVRLVRDGFISFDAVFFTEQGERVAEISNASVREVVNPSLLANASFEEVKPDASPSGPLDIAIVGMSGRYPGSRDVNAFWDNLRDGVDCITEIPKDRWDWEDYFAEERGRPGSVYSKWGGFIEGHDLFDPVFFNISPRDAELMDPQERLFLEHSWMALEDAGYSREALQRPRKQHLPVRVGVYAGVMAQEYPLFAAEASLKGQRIGLPSGISGIAARVSYFFNLNGPSMAVDTMCSSSLTSIYLACQALKERKVDAALAGGVNVSLHPNKYLMLSQAQFVSSKGHCESFGVGADGYIPGEGVGVLVLKRLADAVADGDHVYGVIKGAAINHGGKTSGYTVPSPRAQSLVVAEALEEARVDPRTISYLEAHGTGTQLGDPIEITGLTAAFGRGRREAQVCRIGSAKSNIGHCEAAAGVAGVTKVLLQLEHEQIAPSLHSAVLNPNIDFAATPFQVNQALCAWERPVVDGRARPRRAGISSFGAGGSNAHLIIEEHVPAAADRPRAAAGPVAIVLSARDGDRLVRQARSLLTAVRTRPWTDADLADIAYTLQVGREEMEQRLAFTAATLEELAAKLTLFLDGGGAGLLRGQVRPGGVAPPLASDEPSHVLDAWVQGLKYDWTRMYGGATPRRVSLPSDPFARERYWLPVAAATDRKGPAAAIHPLLHRNSSGFDGLRFSSTFSGQEPFLEGRRLPGAAYLEMAREAVVRAGELADGARLRFEDVRWGAPLVVSGGETIHVGLERREDGRIEVEVFTDPGAEPDAGELKFQASVTVLAPGPVRTVERAAAPAVALRRTSSSDHALPASVLEAAFQAAAGRTTSVEAAFAQALTIHGRCAQEMWAVVRTADRGVDIDLCDGRDNLLVEVKGLTFAAIGQQDAASEVAPPPTARAASGLLREKSSAYFKKLIGATLKLPVHKIDTAASLDQYGIESIFIAQLNRDLSQVFGEIGSTVFFECKTIDALVEYFIDKHRDALARQVGVIEQASAPAHVPATRPALEKRRRRPRTPAGGAEHRPERAREPIAIIGMSGRYPQARGLHEYWENLKAGRDSITEVPEDRWSAEELYHPDIAEAVELRKSYGKWGGFVDGFAEFDPLFFSISPTDALNMDPQERLFIEACWEVFEDAGYTRELLDKKFDGRVGVFVGMTRTGFSLWGPDLWEQGEVLHPRTSFASAANRVSYLLDLKGPSLPVDTGCSSSLTAIHLACEHIHRGECDMAAAGGVNLYLHPSTYTELSAMQMLSTDGRCRSFGDDGTGFVPGEGVGALLLKPLSRALADGDQIYAVIRGTGINHGGKSNGYTVPSPIAQGKLIRQVLDGAGVDARAVSYVEAHGTGTKLGDPIEIAGLQQAFERDTKDTGFCAIGSVKSNIGHAEAAAGIAGITKVILQLKHQLLVPSLHAVRLNPNIDFSRTAFVVQQDLSVWARPVVELAGERREVPRIAGVSSFGAGGANAHVVLEEHVPETRSAHLPVTAMDPAIIVLSARDPERLREYARRLAEAIRQRPLTDEDLRDAAYTLQVGREAMAERLAFTVTSAQELEQTLTRFAEGDEEIEGLHRGQVRRDRDAVAVFATDEDMALTVDAWFAKGKYAVILALWVKGLQVDWSKRHRDAAPRRISLPTYPFARETYWFPTPKRPKGAAGSLSQAAMIHPLLHRNTSDLSRQAFTSLLTGQEPFLADHRIAGKSVLPGVAYLEMARAAVELSAPPPSRGTSLAIKLRDVVWSRPLVVNGQPVAATISLAEDDRGNVSYEISSEAGVHGEGSASFAPIDQLPVVDLGALRDACGRGTVPGERLYRAFADMGIQYGPTHRAVSEVYVGVGELLARLSLPAASWDDGRYVLHPGMLDAALQASLAFVIADPVDAASSGGGAPRRPIMPFALEEAEIFGPCSAALWAHIRRTDGAQQIDVTICDEQGRVIVRLRGLSSRVMKGAVSETHGRARTLAPVWEAFAPRRSAAPPPSLRVCIAGGSAAEVRQLRQRFPDALTLDPGAADSITELTRQLEAGRPIDHLVWIVPESPLESVLDGAIFEQQRRGLLPLFRAVKALLALGYDAKELGWTIVTTRAQRVHGDDPVNPTHAAVHGFVGSMAKEVPGWNVRLLDVADPVRLDELLTLPFDPQGDALAFRDGRWHRQSLVPIRGLAAGRSPYRDGGVYVVVGGAGGIGEIWTEHVIRAHRAHVVWIGRREKDARIQAKLDRLAQIGPAPSYITADASDRDALQAAYQQIKQRHGHIHGLVHSALLLLDKSLRNMDEDRFRAALAPKVDATVHMAQVFAAEPLDFVVFFSAMNAFVRPPGQSNYAAGCTFKDAFALRMAREWRCAVKVMNWGYWGTVGTVASKEYQDRMARQGVGSIEPAEAMEALDALLAGPLDQVAFLKAIDVERSDAGLARETVETYPETAPSVIDSIRQRIVIPPIPHLPMPRTERSA